MSAFTLADDAGKTLVERVMETLRTRITGRMAAPGSKLPSIRTLADQLGVSRSTVVDAYDRLMAEGIVQSRRGSGFYVAAHLPPFSLSDSGPPLAREIDPLLITRQALDGRHIRANPGCGWFPNSWMPQEEIRRALRSLARNSDVGLTEYSTPLGLSDLRILLAVRMADTGVEAHPDQIILTESGTQALDLCCRFLLEPGDRVLIDDPCYFNFLALFRAHRVEAIGVPRTAQGPDLAAFEAALKEHRPRLYITNSGPHNPTGTTISQVTCHRILRLAEAHDLMIVEDDIYADFEERPAPRLAGFDGLTRVIQTGSFSKTLSASMRCGYIAVRPDWVDALVDLKLATSVAGGSMSFELLRNLLKEGSYRRHVQNMRTRLAGAMSALTPQLVSLGIMPWHEPESGVFLWCRLPDGVDGGALTRLAWEKGIVLAPGNAFSIYQNYASFMRFNVAQMQDPMLMDDLKILLDKAAAMAGDAAP
ncbi:PLP-dependent aminotransferase family protein [Altericroceibacterium endophyticum]|uniref:Aminotransferase class I/II-fold pyridoxal phosphate-dependent enzyme n=1 Tax=Altericroceibacterium endophyticum TaxID=1808508 RepID=A0A6I4SZF1_9SPHN|nr:PLP-dependent aminotransferase family protein [Altericroceibacterium endophyticum]MXO64168.1 aminotransferase class I/II-fold pyridoxal phosphate-dependent enzyme [Altericroceibacterium endophyticum]